MYAQNDSRAVLVCLLQSLVPRFPINQSRRRSRNDAGQVQLIGEEIAAISNYGGERNLYFRVVDRSGEPCSQRSREASLELLRRGRRGKNCPTPFATPKCPAMIPARRIWKSAAAVPSFSRLSPSMINDRRLSILRSLKMASTEIGSVAEIIAPKRSAICTGRPVVQWTK